MSEKLNDKYEVFICYRGKKEIVFAAGFHLYHALEKLGIPSFFAPITLGHGDNFYEKLPEYFEKIKVVVLMLTPNFFVEHKDNGEDVVFRELQCAFDNPKIRFFPVIFSGFAGEEEYTKGKRFFSEDDLDRIKHQSASEYHTPYDNNIDFLAQNIKKSLQNGFGSVLLDSLIRLPNDDTSRQFEVNITALAEKYCTDSQIDKDLIAIIEENRDNLTGYKAYYCLNIMYRRIKAYDKMSDIINKYHVDFEKYSSSGHLLGLFYLETGIELDCEKLIDVTFQNRLLFNHNAGYVHLFADIIVTLYEKSSRINKDEFYLKWFDIALDAINRSIELDEKYAKYHCTKARILAMAKKYDEADQSISRAISLENSKKNDYVLRISNYYYYKTMINTDRKLSEISSKKMEAAINV